MIVAILTVLAVYAAVFLLGPWLRAWLARYARRKMEERINAIFGEQFGMNGSPGRQRQGGAQTSAQRPRRHGKIFTREVGEYIEFEEIDEPMPPPYNTKYTPKEPQVTDAEWEDIQ